MASYRSQYDRNVAAMERIVNYEFQDKMLCAQALQMIQTPSAVLPMDGGFRNIPHNTRLAVLGDLVLSQTLCKIWFNSTYPGGGPSPKSAWDSLRQNVLGNTGLYQRGVQLGVQELIFANPGMSRPYSAKMVASTLEAVFGAIYLDGGEDAVTAAVQHIGLADQDTEPY